MCAIAESFHTKPLFIQLLSFLRFYFIRFLRCHRYGAWYWILINKKIIVKHRGKKVVINSLMCRTELPSFIIKPFPLSFRQIVTFRCALDRQFDWISSWWATINLFSADGVSWPSQLLLHAIKIKLRSFSTSSVKIFISPN